MRNLTSGSFHLSLRNIPWVRDVSQKRNSGNVRVQPEKEPEGGDSTGLSKIVEVRSGAALAGCKQRVTIRPQSGLERRESLEVGRKAPRVRLIESVHPVWGSTLAPSVRLSVAAGSGFWSLSVAAVASCCSQHKPRLDFKSGRRHRRSLPRRFLIGSRISRVGESTFRPATS